MAWAGIQLPTWQELHQEHGFVRILRTRPPRPGVVRAAARRARDEQKYRSRLAVAEREIWERVEYLRTRARLRELRENRVDAILLGWQELAARPGGSTFHRCQAEWDAQQAGRQQHSTFH